MYWNRSCILIVSAGLFIACQQPPEPPERTLVDTGAEHLDTGVDDVEDVDDDKVIDAAHPDADSEPSDAGSPQPPGKLNGTWVQLISTSVLTETVIGDDNESKNVSVRRVEVDHRGDQIWFDTEVCSLEILEESTLTETTIPDAFVESLQPPRREGTYVDGGLEIAEETQLRGVQFEDGVDVKTEPLPTEPDDPRVYDQDGDGNPGLTVEVDATLAGGEIYVVQRVIDRFESNDVTDDEVFGFVDWSEDQEILDASDSRLLMAEPETRPHPDKEANYFHMLRLGENEADDCDTLAQRRDELFDVDAP